MATSVKDSTFPVILGRDLPIYSGTPSQGDSVVAIINNTRLMRIPISTFADGAIQAGETAPTDPHSFGSAGAVAWGSGGFYTYLDGTWGLSPRVTVHWEDYTDDSRFLLVNKDQGLSEGEKEQGRNNLDIGLATEEKAGLVKIKKELSDGETGDEVPTVYAVSQYLKSFSDGVNEGLRHATTEVFGVVKLASEITASDSGVPTAAMVFNFFRSNVGNGGSYMDPNYSSSDIVHATTLEYGIVRLAGEISSSNMDIPTSGMVYSFVLDQLKNADLAVGHATTSSYGTVQLASSISSGDNNIPTSGQVADYVNTKVAQGGGGGGGGGSVDHATTSSYGTVRLAVSISGSESGVPSGKQVYDYVQSKLSGAGGGGGSSGSSSQFTEDEVSTLKKLAAMAAIKTLTTSTEPKYIMTSNTLAGVEQVNSIPGSKRTDTFYIVMNGTALQY